MKRILLTGMSGTGKSTVIGELAARGYKAVDADSDEFSQWVEVADSTDAEVAPVEGNRDWVWREDRMQVLLSTEDTDVLFVSGCADNIPMIWFSSLHRCCARALANSLTPGLPRLLRVGPQHCGAFCNALSEINRLLLRA